jgi:hypothetical protein
MANKNVAGGSPAKANPKVPNRASENESYNLVEDVNAGPNGARKGKVSAGHNQTADSVAGYNELIGIDGNQQDPYRAKGSDWPDGKTSADAGHGQGSGADYESPNGGEKNRLIDDSQNQCGPRFIEDDGPGQYGSGTPVPGNRAARVAANFSIDRNDGESRSDGGESGIPQSIDLQTGYIVGGDQTVVREVPQFNVSIGTKKSAGYKSGRVAKDLK